MGGANDKDGDAFGFRPKEGRLKEGSVLKYGKSHLPATKKGKGATLREKRRVLSDHQRVERPKTLPT